MEYIVFDLEWNQCPEGKSREDVCLPFEIIEIGAWRLNEKRQFSDKFHVIIRPKVYKGIHFRTREVIHMDDAMLKSGIPFPEAARRFLEWCGEDYCFCTWGDSDLTEFQRNLKYYHMEDCLKGPIYYLDIQKIFSRNFEDGRSRKSLEYGIDFLELPKSREFHRASEDAWYTACILQRLDEKILRDYYSVNVYQNPRRKKEELHIFYPEYEKYVSREFQDKEAAMRDREVCSTRCPLCHKAARRKIRWFAVNSRRYYSVSLCEEHGMIKGKVRMKKTDAGKYYVVKTLKPISEEEVEAIREKQENIRQKRRIKRQHDREKR